MLPRDKSAQMPAGSCKHISVAGRGWGTRKFVVASLDFVWANDRLQCLYEIFALWLTLLHCESYIHREKVFRQ